MTVIAASTADSEMKRTKTEVEQMKAARVALLKRQREEAERHRTAQAARQREIAQLKKVGRTQRYEFQKREAATQKREAVLRRRNEHLAALAKRYATWGGDSGEVCREAVWRMWWYPNTRIVHSLKGDIEKQRSAKVPSASTGGFREWFKGELQLRVELLDAKKGLAELMERRKIANASLRSVVGKSSSTSRVAWSETPSTDTRALREEVATCSRQIGELNACIASGERRSREVSATGTWSQS
jgi:hypothetical protein